MNIEYICKVSSKNSKWLLKKFAKYDRGLLFLPHLVYTVHMTGRNYSRHIWSFEAAVPSDFFCT